MMTVWNAHNLHQTALFAHQTVTSGIILALKHVQLVITSNIQYIIHLLLSTKMFAFHAMKIAKDV